jgi:hypothetical protein
MEVEDVHQKGRKNRPGQSGEEKRRGGGRRQTTLCRFSVRLVENTCSNLCEIGRERERRAWRRRGNVIYLPVSGMRKHLVIIYRLNNNQKYT